MRCALVFAAVVFASCGWPTNTQADGGRARVNCDAEDEVLVPVKILDASGQPTSEATVTAVNSTDSTKTVSGMTNGSGVFTVSSKLGPGVIKVTGALNDLKTPEGNFTVTDSDCTPAVSPNNLVLRLQ